MPTATPNYGSPVTLTLGLATGPLASDTNLVAGRQSTVADQASDDCIDALVGGKITTGTSPTAARQIEVWAFGTYDGTSYGGGAGATDANLTPQASQKSQFRLLTVIPTNATSNQLYTWGPFSIAAAFGGTMPAKWGIFVVHNTGVALNATAGNHECKYTPVKYESA
jgi:hypothetical protein